MISRPPDQADAERAVAAFKHPLLLRVMRQIVDLALHQTFVYAGDIPEDIVDKEHRQGVVSNAWGCLSSLEIIAKLDMRYFNEAHGILAGKKANPNPSAKGRMVVVYQLKNRALAQQWLKRNFPPAATATAAGQTTPEQGERAMEQIALI